MRCCRLLTCAEMMRHDVTWVRFGWGTLRWRGMAWRRHEYAWMAWNSSIIHSARHLPGIWSMDWHVWRRFGLSFIFDAWHHKAVRMHNASYLAVPPPNSFTMSWRSQSSLPGWHIHTHNWSQLIRDLQSIFYIWKHLFRRAVSNDAATKYIFTKL